MKQLIWVWIFIFSISVFHMNAQEMIADVNKSKIKWTGKKTKSFHYGFIQLKSGAIHIEADKITSGKFVVDMKRFTCEDIKDHDLNAKLLHHLKSDDFFGVKKYPVAILDITTPTQLIDGKALIKGDLTIKGITHPVEFDATRTENNFKAKIIIDRSKYNVRYGSKTFFNDLGDKAIDDEFILDIDLLLE